MLYQYFKEHATRYSDLIALEIGSKQYSYSALDGTTQNVAQWLDQSAASSVVGLLAAKSLSTYAGVLGVLAARRCFVPFTKKMPPARIVEILNETGVNTLIVGEEYLELFEKVQHAADRSLMAIRPEAAQPEQMSPGVHRAPANVVDAPALDTDTAYILYTSGSTGKPKGIPVTQKNVMAYLENVLPQYELGPDDRCSQMFDLTFDPSIHDMFVTWSSGAALVIPNPNEIIAPRKFIIDRQITVFATVPSTAYFMMKTRMLRPDDFPRLRYTLFTGEALPYNIFRAWQVAAPNAQIMNGYGPTELTINIAAYAIPSNLENEDCYNGIVPIGSLFDGHNMKLLNPSDSGLAEFAVSGPQVVRGYINNWEKTEEAFFVDGARYYRTGDLVAVDAEGILHFAGRVDSQIKLRGYRVELSEIEARIKEKVGGEVVVLAWPYHEGIAQGVIAFHDDPGAVHSDIVMHCRSALPEYMIPTQIHVLSEFPMNSNGKIDRNRLLESIA